MNLRLLYPRLALGLLLVGAPLALYQPPWLSLGWLTVLLLRWLQVHRGRPQPPGWVRMGLTFAGLAAVLLTYGTVAGRDAGVALLGTMTALKLLEVTRPRDLYLAVFLGYFLVITNFLYSQEIPMAIYLLLSVLALTSTLIAINRGPSSAPATADLRLAARLMLQGLPVMVVLFVLFPRVDEPLWHMPDRGPQATTGISDTMEPGSISELVASNAVAFRVDFDGEPPPQAQRYWRGPVLWFTNGRRWRAGTPPRPEGIGFTGLGDPVSYTVTLEPHRQRWLFALDLPAEVPINVAISTDFQVLAERPVVERRLYRALSYLNYTTGPPSPAESRSALQLPSRVSLRVRALAQQWRTAAGGDDAALVNLALAHFREQPFVYTLSPPLLPDDPIDGFLFETRRGFCEHYAASFTLLMRLAGIPTRIVTGYQGGELNPLGGYLIVRQSDAHAWTEAWLPGRGWTRIDPTAAVAPERIELGIDADASLGFDGAVRFRGGQIPWLSELAERAVLAIDAVNAKWNFWVLGYNAGRQLDFLRDLGLGIESWYGLTVALGIVVGTLLVTIGWSIMRLPRTRLDPAAVAYRHFCARLARRGLRPRTGEAPGDFAHRVGLQRPDLAEGVAHITRLYVAQRYAPAPAVALLSELRRAVRGFRP